MVLELSAWVSSCLRNSASASCLSDVMSAEIGPVLRLWVGYCKQDVVGLHGSYRELIGALGILPTSC